jgi:hypothetical protein
MGKTHIIVSKDAERDEEEEIATYVNTSYATDNLVQIDSLFISQKHLECLTNPYVETRYKYLGDEVNIPQYFLALTS